MVSGRDQQRAGRGRKHVASARAETRAGLAARLGVPVPAAIELELEWEKSVADEQEHGNELGPEREQAHGKERA